MNKPSWQAVVVAVAFVALVAFMFYEAAQSSSFSTVWAGAGTLVGVVTGAIPSYFFHQDAKTANAKVQAISSAASPEVIDRAKELAPRAFRND
jgi:uncharacterized membrane protein YdjX (TVP38/TMEM64 family)